MQVSSNYEEMDLADRGPLKVGVQDNDGIVILSPVGEVGYHEAPALRTAIKETFDRKPRRLVINLTGVSYMATPGVATLVEALQISKRTATPLVLCNLTDRVRAIFEIARLQTVFKIVPDLDSALA